MNKMDIGIVGGSIAGCSAAILLRQAGHNVCVFERSASRLVGRGSGISTSAPVFAAMSRKNIIDADIPHLPETVLPFIIRTEQHERLGYSPWQTAIDLKAFHWSALWNNLRKRVPDEVYKQGYEVINAQTKDDQKVTLQFKDGSCRDFDLVLFADGYQSTGRKLLFPDVKLKYRGYMLWRGLLPEAEMSDAAFIENTMPRIAYTHLPGDFVIYLVPGLDGSVEKGRRLFNWAAYIPVAQEKLPEFMIDRDANFHSGSIPPGKMRPEEEKRLKQLMRHNLPTYYGDIVNKTQNTFVQLIYTTQLPAYHRKRMALIGDAGIFVQPFTGSGVFKGYNNVKDLLLALKTYEKIDTALEDWSMEQVRIGERLLDWGEQLEKAYIWNKLDLANANANTTARWWKDAVTFPEEFSFGGE